MDHVACQKQVMTPIKLKTLALAAIKITVFVIAVLYLYDVFEHNLDVLNQSKPQNGALFIAVIVLNILLYTATLMVLGWSWINLTAAAEPGPLFRIYLKSQIYKYIPSNLMHFVYRHTASKQAGMTHQALIQATISESLSLVAAALLTATMIYQWPAMLGVVSDHVPVVLSVCLHLGILLLAGFMLFHRNPMPNAIKSLLGHLVYFITMGFICFWLASELAISGWSFLQLTSVFAIAWLCGYVIPGAPGGLGVREAVFVFLSGQLIAPAQALVLIATIRLINLMGEALVYVLAQYQTGSNMKTRMHGP